MKERSRGQEPKAEGHRDKGLTPELAALMATVREASGESHRTFGQEVDWSLLMALAAREGATRALFERVSRLSQERVGIRVAPSTLAALKARAQRQELKILALDGQLSRLLRLYQGEGVAVILLKGQAFQRGVLDSPLERPTNDLDLLVSNADAKRSWELAQTYGWNWDPETWPWDRYRDHHHLPPLKDKLGLRLEIHTDLLPGRHPFRFSAEQVRSRAMSLSRQPGVMVPCSEHLLLHAAIHFAWSHEMEFGVWRTFRDVSTLVERDLVDWDDFLADTEASRAKLAAFWTLHLAKQWAGVPVPRRVLDALVPTMPSWARAALDRHFAAGLTSPLGVDSDPQVRSVWLSRKLWEMAMRPDGFRVEGARPWRTGLGQRSLSPGGNEKIRSPIRRAFHFMRVVRGDFLHLTTILSSR